MNYKTHFFVCAILCMLCLPSGTFMRTTCASDWNGKPGPQGPPGNRKPQCSKSHEGLRGYTGTTNEWDQPGKPGPSAKAGKPGAIGPPGVKGGAKAVCGKPGCYAKWKSEYDANNYRRFGSV